MISKSSEYKVQLFCVLLWKGKFVDELNLQNLPVHPIMESSQWHSEIPSTDLFLCNPGRAPLAQQQPAEAMTTSESAKTEEGSKQEEVQASEELLETVLKAKAEIDLECPVCLTFPNETPRNQCQNGHLVCNECSTHLDKCPLCRESLENVPNRFAASLLRCLILHEIRLQLSPPGTTQQHCGLQPLEDDLGALKKTLKCIQCTKPTEDSPIHCCEKGHFLCKLCHQRWEGCPQCKGTLVRNLVAERFLSTFPNLPPLQWEKHSVEEKMGSHLVWKQVEKLTEAAWSDHSWWSFLQWVMDMSDSLAEGADSSTSPSSVGWWGKPKSQLRHRLSKSKQKRYLQLGKDDGVHPSKLRTRQQLKQFAKLLTKCLLLALQTMEDYLLAGKTARPPAVAKIASQLNARFEETCSHKIFETEQKNIIRQKFRSLEASIELLKRGWTKADVSNLVSSGFIKFVLL